MTMSVLSDKNEQTTVYEYNSRSCTILAKIEVQNKIYLLTDSMFTIDIIDIEEKKVAHSIEIPGGSLRCCLVIGKYIILGIQSKETSNILAYNAQTFAKVYGISTENFATPLCLAQKGKSFFVAGLDNGCIQLFQVHTGSQELISVGSRAIKADISEGEIY
jgi:hypothetical protein